MHVFVWGVILSVLLGLTAFPSFVVAQPLRPRLGYTGQMVCVGVAIVQNVAMAVVLGFAQAPLYAPYAQLGTAPGAFSALQDQQLGAGIMWTFGDLPFGIALSALFQRWLAAHSDDASVAIPAPRAQER